MLKEKEKRPNNKREDEVKTFKIGEREDAIWKERRAKIINDRLYMIHDSHWDTTSLWISIGLFILFSNSFSEEFALSNCGTLPYVNSLFYPEEWYEEKCAYDKVLVGLVWSEYTHVGLILFFSSAEICVSRKTFFWLKYFSNEFYMRLICYFNE